MSAQKRLYPFLDGFRAVAILMVLVDHLRIDFHINRWLANHSFVFHNDFSLWCQEDLFNVKGVLGVQVFFILSGFFITRILINNMDKDLSVARFYQRRFLKIYPSYLLLLLVSFFIFILSYHSSLSQAARPFVRYMLFLQNYFYRNPLLEHTWSLVVTEQFYFFAPLVVFAVYRWTPSWEKRWTALVWISLSLMAIAPLFQIYFLHTNQPLISWPLKAPFPFLTTAYHSGSLSFGCLLALFEPYWSCWPKKKRLGYIFAAAGYLGYYYLFFYKNWNYFSGSWYFYSLGYLMFGCLFMAAYHGVSFLANRPWMQWIGRHSYGIYLWHYLIFNLAARWQDRMPGFVLIILSCFMSLAAGVLSTITVERYFLSWRDKALEQKAGRQRYYLPAWGSIAGVCLLTGLFVFGVCDPSQSEKTSQGVSGLVQQGVAAMDKGKAALAMEIFTKVIKADPGNAHAYNDRGLLYYNQGNFDAAIRDFNKALSLAPDSAATYDNLGMVYQDRHDLNRAIDAYSKAIEYSPEFAQAYSDLGNVYYYKGDLYQAMVDYDYALFIDPGMGSAYVNRAELFFMNDHFDKARQDVRQAQALGYKVDDNLLKALEAAPSS